MTERTNSIRVSELPEADRGVIHGWLHGLIDEVLRGEIIVVATPREMETIGADAEGNLIRRLTGRRELHIEWREMPKGASATESPALRPSGHPEYSIEQSHIPRPDKAGSRPGDGLAPGAGIAGLVRHSGGMPQLVSLHRSSVADSSAQRVG